MDTWQWWNAWDGIDHRIIDWATWLGFFFVLFHRDRNDNYEIPLKNQNQNVQGRRRRVKTRSILKFIHCSLGSGHYYINAARTTEMSDAGEQSRGIITSQDLQVPVRPRYWCKTIMGRAPCCDKANVKRGPWSPDEDAILKGYIESHGTGGNWITLPQKAGQSRLSIANKISLL